MYAVKGNTVLCKTSFGASDPNPSRQGISEVQQDSHYEYLRASRVQISVFVAKKIRIATNARIIVRGNKGTLFGATKALCSGQQRRFVRGNKDALFGATKHLCEYPPPAGAARGYDNVLKINIS
jgi:hypothetical protein